MEKDSGNEEITATLPVNIELNPSSEIKPAPPVNITSVEHKGIEAEIKNEENDSVNFLLDMFSTGNIPTDENTIEQPKTEAKIQPVTTDTMLLTPSATLESKNTAPVSPSNETSIPSSKEGQRFVDWLKAKLLQDKLAFNDRTAKVHIVDNCLFLVSPSSFELYLQENGLTYNEEVVNNLQYEFQALGLHKKRLIGEDSTNFWRCRVIGPRKDSFLVGYLIPNTQLFFGEKILINNRHLLLEE